MLPLDGIHQKYVPRFKKTKWESLKRWLYTIGIGHVIYGSSHYSPQYSSQFSVHSPKESSWSLISSIMRRINRIGQFFGLISPTLPSYSTHARFATLPAFSKRRIIFLFQILFTIALFLLAVRYLLLKGGDQVDVEAISQDIDDLRKATNLNVPKVPNLQPTFDMLNGQDKEINHHPLESKNSEKLWNHAHDEALKHVTHTNDADASHNQKENLIEDDSENSDSSKMNIRSVQEQALELLRFDEENTAINSSKHNSILVDQTERANRVKDAFLHAWKGYSKYAWGHDEINPVSKQPYDSWGKFGATIVDSLDTMYLMGLKDEFEKAKDFVRRLRFDKDEFVSFFETSIRYLGGLLGAYDLSKDAIFLQKAKELADQMLPAFDSETGIPYNQVNLKTGETKNPSWTDGKSILSEVGSVQLEWKYLSHHTNNPIYWNKVENVMNILDNAHREHKGLYPLLINEKSGQFYNSKVSFGGLGDSFYEYLLKQYLLTNKSSKKFEEMYTQSVLDMKKHLLKASINGDVFIAEMDNYSTYNDFEHLACFIPGMLILGAEEIPSRSIDEHLATKILQTCVKLYTDNESGLPPDHVRFNTEGIGNSYFVVSPKYILRPETIESLYYMYKHTGNELWREYAWQIFLKIEEHCKTEAAYSGIIDTTVPVDKLEHNSAMETFFTAETLKYLYLIFKPNLINLRDIVITTEAHILSRFDQN